MMAFIGAWMIVAGLMLVLGFWPVTLIMGGLALLAVFSSR